MLRIIIETELPVASAVTTGVAAASTTRGTGAATSPAAGGATQPMGADAENAGAPAGDMDPAERALAEAVGADGPISLDGGGEDAGGPPEDLIGPAPSTGATSTRRARRR